MISPFHMYHGWSVGLVIGTQGFAADINMLGTVKNESFVLASKFFCTSQSRSSPR